MTLIGFVLAATAVLAANGAAEPERHGAAGVGSAESGVPLQGWGKNIELASSSSTRSVGVWAVEGPRRLRMRSARLHEVSTGGSGRLALGPIEAVTLVAKGKVHEVVTNAATVGELLSAMRIEPDGNDRVDPPPRTPITLASRITYTAFSVRTANMIQPLPSPPMTVSSDRLPAGYSETVTAGRPARILRTYRLRFVNGKIVGKTLVFSRVLRPGVPGKRVVGTAHSSMQGEASWYYIDTGLTAASPWLPFGTHVMVTNLATGASVTVVINDRGPFGGRLIDLSEAAFSQIAPLGQGVCWVSITW